MVRFSRSAARPLAGLKSELALGEPSCVESVGDVGEWCHDVAGCMCIYVYIYVYNRYSDIYIYR